jgi:hypothetical protein
VLNSSLKSIAALNLYKILLQLRKFLIILDTKTQLMYLDQEQQGMVKRVLVMTQQHCGTPYQTMQGVFQLQKIIVVEKHKAKINYMHN